MQVVVRFCTLSVCSTIRLIAGASATLEQIYVSLMSSVPCLGFALSSSLVVIVQGCPIKCFTQIMLFYVRFLNTLQSWVVTSKTEFYSNSFCSSVNYQPNN